MKMFVMKKIALGMGNCGPRSSSWRKGKTLNLRLDHGRPSHSLHIHAHLISQWPGVPRILPKKCSVSSGPLIPYPRRQNAHQCLALISSAEGGRAGVIFSVSWWIIALRNEIFIVFHGQSIL